MFAATPDIITCVKGLTSGSLPLGAMILSDRILAEIAEAGGEPALDAPAGSRAGRRAEQGAVFRECPRVDRGSSL